MADNMIIPPLSAYRVSTLTGFVPEADPVALLPAGFEPWEAIVPDISALIRTRRFRGALSELPQLDSMELIGDSDRERALLLLTVFANGWVWGGDEPDLMIPSQIAAPLCALADTMRRPPIVHYASMALNNWRRIDCREPVSADNARMQVQFLGGVDEDWFFIGSIGVELAGAPLIATVRDSVIASHGADDEALARLLNEIAARMEPVIVALDRMRQWCDPQVFYHRVRPFLAGWPQPGARYEGVSDKPTVHIGGSAGQSSLIQAVDAALGVEHRPAATSDYLRRLRDYMPPLHRKLVEDITARSHIRSRVGGGAPSLRAAYNAAIAQVGRFRHEHINLSTSYVLKPSGMAVGEKGTGGTDLVAFLGSAQQSTDGARL